MLTPSSGSTYQTPACASPSASDVANMAHAIESARVGFEEEGQGIPIGACLVDNETGKVLGVGRNRRVQMGSATRHGEIDLLENLGRLPAAVYRRCTLYTTLSPCTMCSGACVLYGIPRVVIGENSTFLGGEHILRDHGVELVNLDSPQCKDLMRRFIEARPEVWCEDIGEADEMGAKAKGKEGSAAEKQ